MAFKSAFGSRSDMSLPEYYPSAPKSGHGFLHNLLSDAINTAKGIPFGMVELVKHPKGSLKAMGKSYQDYYGHGWGHFKTQFMAHPLQPLLDAVSIPLVLAGGLGVGVKGASFAANIGKDTGMLYRASELAKAGKWAESDALRAQAMPFPKLDRAAQHFRRGTSATTRMVPVLEEGKFTGISLPKAYSANMFRRFLTKGSDSLLEAMIPGRAAHLGERMLAKELKGKRPAATAAEAKKQARVLVGAKTATRKAEKRGEDVGFTPDDVIQGLGNIFEVGLVAGALKVPAEHAQRLAKSKTFKSELEFIYEQPAESGFLTASGAAGTPVAKNMVRVYRGERVTNKKKGRWFTPDREYAAAYAGGPGRALHYVDVPRAVYLRGLRETLKDQGDPSFPESSSAAVLPREWAGRALPVERLTEKRRVFTGTPAKPAGIATRELTMKSYEPKTMLNAIQTMGERVVTGQDVKRALVRDGNVLVVRRGIHEDHIRELERTAKMADHVYRSGLSAWKGIILGLSPRYFINNVVGNWLMYLAATNPVEVTRGLLTATRDVHGMRRAAKDAKRMEGTLDGLMKKYLPDDWVSSRTGYLQHGALGLEQTAAFGLKTKIRRAGHAKLYSATEKVSYRAPQRAALMGALHTDSDFRNAYRYNLKRGMERGEAYRAAADTIFSDTRKAAAFEKRVTDWAGQYYHLNSLEKKITAFVPFYTWDRHALRFGKEQVLSRPVRSEVLAQLGALGDEEADKELGKIPDFMKGAIPVKGHKAGILGFLLGQNIQGREKILLTAGYNPLAAAADNAASIAAMFGKGPRSPAEAFGGQVNPIISGFLSGVTGQRLFSGAQAETHDTGPVGGAIHETFVELPHAKLIKQLLGEKPPTVTSKGKPTLYEKGLRQTISSIMGINERDFSPEAARRLAAEKEGGKRKKKRKARQDLGQLKSQLKSNY